MKCQVTMDQHMKAFDRLEKWGVSLFLSDVDQLMCMIEQVVIQEGL